MILQFTRVLQISFLEKSALFSDYFFDLGSYALFITFTSSKSLLRKKLKVFGVEHFSKQLAFLLRPASP